MIQRLIPILVVCLLAIGSSTAEFRSFTLLEYGRLELDVPDGWDMTINTEESGTGPAFQFEPPGGTPLVLLVTPIPVPDPSPEKVRRAVQETAQEALDRMKEIAVEDDLTLKESNGPHCRMLYVSATDRTVEQPSLEDFKYGDQGAAEVGGIMLTFTLLTNIKDAAERATALGIVRSARHIAPQASPTASSELSLLDKNWSLRLELTGFRVGNDELRPDRLARKVVFQHEDTRKMLTVVMKPTQHMSVASIRDQRWDDLLAIPPAEESPRLWEQADRAYFSYFSEIPVEGGPLHQKHVHTFLIHEGTRIEIHVSVVRYASEDEPWLEAFQRAIGIETSSMQP